jgi:hypothetical protein
MECKRKAGVQACRQDAFRRMHAAVIRPSHRNELA